MAVDALSLFRVSRMESALERVVAFCLARSHRQRRVPDAVRHSSCRSAEPGPYQAPVFVTAPALQRTASQGLRAALRPGHALTQRPRMHPPLRMLALDCLGRVLRAGVVGKNRKACRARA